jgi:malic enzyme
MYLGFPFIFRGALDVQARKINMPMKMAAAHAIANLAKEPLTADLKALLVIYLMEESILFQLLLIKD